MPRRRAVAALLVAMTAACGSSRRSEPGRDRRASGADAAAVGAAAAPSGVAAPSGLTDAAPSGVPAPSGLTDAAPSGLADAAPTGLAVASLADAGLADAVDPARAALVDAAASSDLCAIIETVFAAQDRHLTTLIAPGPPVALRGLPVPLPASTVQLAGARAVMRTTEDDGVTIGGDWTAYLDRPSDAAVAALIATAATCPRITDWYSVVVDKTNRSWSRIVDLHEVGPGATRVRTFEVWIAGGPKRAWVTITVVDDTALSGD